MARWKLRVPRYKPGPRDQGRSELLPPKPGETLPGYDNLEFKMVRSCVNGQEVIV
jgi:hypothetical protein